MKYITILGSTGSIGTTTLKVIDSFPNEFSVVGISGYSNIELLIQQAKKYNPMIVAIADKSKYAQLRSEIPTSIDVVAGDEGLIQVATLEKTTLLVSAIVGFAGLYPTFKAIEKGIDVALANKEILVVAGDIITRQAVKNNVRLFPLDSEHNAIFQCLNAQKKAWVNRLILTASGGPLLNIDKEKFSEISVSQALAHPNWEMGKKISIDSATMMNKGLEVIEAHWLFDIPMQNIDVVVHPESIIHSMVEFVDGSYLAQMNIPDMAIPIQYILTYPERRTNCSNHTINFAKLGRLQFIAPDKEKFPCLQLAYNSIKQGNTMPAVLNAANECAVNFFLNEHIKFVDIPIIIEKVMEKHNVITNPCLDDLVYIDTWARQQAQEESGIV